MTEYACAAFYEESDKAYNFLTCGAVTLQEAIQSFARFLHQEHQIDLTQASHAHFQRVDVEH